MRCDYCGKPFSLSRDSPEWSGYDFCNWGCKQAMIFTLRREGLYDLVELRHGAVEYYLKGIGLDSFFKGLEAIGRLLFGGLL